MTEQMTAPPCAVKFAADPVEHDPNVRDREQVVDGVRWALVEYAPGAGREDWCSAPHMGYVVSGELTYSFEDGREPLRLRAGDGFALPTAPGHAGRNNGSEPARILVIDALAQG